MQNVYTLIDIIHITELTLFNVRSLALHFQKKATRQCAAAEQHRKYNIHAPGSYTMINNRDVASLFERRINTS